jgi:hypothetical protein
MDDSSFEARKEQIGKWGAESDVRILQLNIGTECIIATLNNDRGIKSTHTQKAVAFCPTTQAHLEWRLIDYDLRMDEARREKKCSKYSKEMLFRRPYCKIQFLQK